MVPITSEISLNFHSIPYIGRLVLSYYPSSLRPALLFVDPDGSPIAKISTNPEYFPANIYAFAVKTWTENEGILSQLLALRNEDDEPLFVDLNFAVPAGREFAPLLSLTKPLQKTFSSLLKTEGL